MLNLCVVGLGYIGLPTAVICASNGIKVTGFDVNKHLVAAINNYKCSVVEPELEKLLTNVVTKENFIAKSEIVSADVFVITVPTPFTEDKKPDLKYVKQAVESIATVIKKGDLIILESTSPVGTTAIIADWLQKLKPDLNIPVEDSVAYHDVNIAYCPERVLPGKIMYELVHNDRIIGGLTKSCADCAYNFYKLFVKGDCIKTRARVAALSKLTENSFRDVNIAFANEISMICSKAGIEVTELQSLVNLHPRVNMLEPGCGVGGHCIPVDPWFIVDSFPEQAKIIKCARIVNDSKPEFIVASVLRKLKEITNPKILCLGLSYKPNTGDLRQSPAIKIVELLAQHKNLSIFVVEPYIKCLPDELSNFNNIELVDSFDDKFDYVLSLVKHDQFNSLEINGIMEDEYV